MMTWQLALVTTTVMAVAVAGVRSWWVTDGRAGRRLLRRRDPAADPMVTLAVQMRLGRLARELQTVSEDPDVYARAHHWHAAQAAYDALLREACGLAGIDVADPPLRADERSATAERLREELELSSRGWSW